MNKKIIAAALVLAAVYTAACRPPEKEITKTAATPRGAAMGDDYFSSLRAILEKEDQLYRQLTEHQNQFAIKWPFEEAANMVRNRTMKLKSMLQENNASTAVEQQPTVEVSSLDDALVKDAALQKEIEKMYHALQDIQGRNNYGFNIAMISSAAATSDLLTVHDGVPANKLKEYQGKKYAKPQ